MIRGGLREQPASYFFVRVRSEEAILSGEGYAFGKGKFMDRRGSFDSKHVRFRQLAIIAPPPIHRG